MLCFDSRRLCDRESAGVAGMTGSMSYEENETIGGGRYRIISRIGGGAMGEVFKAEHIAMHKTVAIKLMHADISTNTDLVERFRREAIATGQLQHSNICAVSDFDQTEDGKFFIVMEMLEGESLQDRLLSVKTMQPPQALGIIRQLLNALQCAHENGIVHRDVKPENIYLVKRDNTEDFVKLIDFGIAHRENPVTATSTLTRAGEIYGTPQYLSPEQAKGENVDNRADLYACGIILFEMLMGHPPFEAPNYIELLNKQVFTPAPHLDESIPQSQMLDDIIQKLLAKDPNDRYTSATDVIADIDNVQFILDATSPDKAEAMASIAHLNPAIASASYAAITDNSEQFERSSRLTVILIGGIVVVLTILVIIVLATRVPDTYLDTSTDTVIYKEKKQLGKISPQPFNYQETGFTVSYDSILSNDRNMISAVENFPEKLDSVTTSMNAVEEKFQDHPNFLRLKLLMLNEPKEQNRDYEAIFTTLEKLLEIVPDAGRNGAVRGIIFELLNSKTHHDHIMQVLTSHTKSESATGIAWMIIESPYDRYEIRLNRLIECYDKLDHKDVPEWLDKAVNIWRLDKNDCSARFQLMIQLEAEKSDDFFEYVIKPFHASKTKRCGRDADCNECMRSWLEQIVNPRDIDKTLETKASETAETASGEEDKPKAESTPKPQTSNKKKPVSSGQKSTTSKPSSKPRNGSKKSSKGSGNVLHDLGRGIRRTFS